MTESTASRIRRVLTDKRLRQNEVARALGVTPQAVSRWMRPENRPEWDQIERLAAFLRVPAGYLAFGEGAPGNARTLKIRRYDFGASCGTGICEQEPVDVEVLEVSEDWARRHVPNFSGDLEGLSLITAHGDSMSPTWSDGSILLVDNRVRQVNHDGLYVFHFDGVTYAKRVALIGAALLIISDNDRYPPFRIEPQQRAGVVVAGRVIKALNLVDLA